MTQPLDWFPAPFEPYGGTSGLGARRLLGTPSLDPLTVLVRETVQNSWDARRADAGQSPLYSIGLRTLTRRQRDLLCSTVFPEGTGRCLGLEDSLRQEDVRVLEVSDRGTSGLAGPVQADIQPAENEPTDFVDFVFNIGSPRDTRLGGGTYGFGKTIAYVVSRPSTLLVLSRLVRNDGEEEIRVIGSAIGSEFADGDRRYTGRHWWGRVHNGRIEPLTGVDAEAIAGELGVKFESTGTTLIIIDPDQRERDNRGTVDFLVTSLVWHLWPKMVPPPFQTSPPMRFVAALEGEVVPIPDPSTWPALRPFVTALQQVRLAQAGVAADVEGMLASRTIKIESQRPIQTLGHLGLVKAAAGRSHAVTTDRKEEIEDTPVDAAPFREPAHHVALMRQAELVVTYLEGPPSPVEGVSWAGTFRCSEDVDNHFAESEPPAHDEWDPEFVEDRHGRTFVRVGLRRIAECARSFAAPELPRVDGDSRLSAARVGDRLWSLVPSVTGTAPSPDRRQGSSDGPRSPRRRATVDILDTRRLEVAHQGMEVQVDFRIEGDTDTVTVRADAGVLTDTGREASAPEGSEPPRIVALECDHGGQVEQMDGGTYRLTLARSGRWTLTLAHNEVTAMDIRIHAEPAD